MAEEEKKDIVAFISRKDVQAGISNFIHNQLKISRQEVFEVMKARVDEVVEHRIKEVLDSKYFQGLVENVIARVIKEGVPNSFYGRDDFVKFVTGEIRAQVRQAITDKYEFIVDVVTKGYK